MGTIEPSTSAPPPPSGPRGPTGAAGPTGGRGALRRRARAWAVLLTVLAVLWGTAGTAGAATGVEKIAEQLRSSPVYVDPAASDKLSAAEAQDLAARIRDSGVPIYVAVLPADPSYGGGRIFDRLRAAVGEPGVYAVALGSDFGAASDSSVLPGSTSRSIAARNVQEHPGDPSAILDGFVADVSAAVAGGGTGDRGSPGTGGSSGAGAGVLVTMLVLLGLLAGAGLYGARRSARRRREEEREQLEQVRAAVEEDITAYGEALDRLDFHPSDPKATPQMLEDYGRALDAYETAKARSAAARRPQDVRAVSEALEDGRFSLAVLDARREGRPLPERRPPCFFDPRHGPSVEDAQWAPDGGSLRPVPVCAADAARIADGLDPAVRTVSVDGRQRPYWDAGPAYAPWAGGYYGAYGSMLLPGLLIGTMLGNSMGPAHALGAGYYGDYGGGGDFGGGFGGDFGGGGGGDFGGGFGDSGGF
ncbi:hypothetical protein ACFV1B_05280 [Streptomyces sp. NPDC059637]|uniref:hypothetical protein n=1 Tax=Streptomyces sp. NPDC059637 TaxID=3347752 RepID=UPI0036B15241